MVASRLPLDSKWPFHASAPTRAQCPGMLRSSLHFSVSHSWTSLLLVPMAIRFDLWLHATDVTCDPSPVVCISCVIPPLPAFHR